MPYLFDHLDMIGELLRRSPFGLITDVDGTISPTVATPQQAKVSRLCHRYLASLCHQLALVAAISGRQAAEVKNMIGIDGMVYIGNHGLERWTEGHSEFLKGIQDYSGVIKAVLAELAPLLSSIEGIGIQDKGVTATIHYRLTPEPQVAERQILSAIRKSPRARELRLMREKMAIDLLPPVEANKGTATLQLIREYNLRGAIYLGDDLTDIYAFRAVRAAADEPDFQGLAIAIVSLEMPEGLVAEADFTLNGVSDVERFLQWLSQTVGHLSV